ncbi:hypothetical protein CLV84_4327 [Neolewinella xylanilytica]|uniref:Uncharacterized protein n=1 Tax=Neolewinella xylanilytica TaxID=1514080 RepID=A0A2S6HZN9_9BACT|nr:hypothetical protein [Neolewinella xylanilytica]PPK83807.1 hypothetical protein CLV84_4327 [Neolewinella xylanilytica]
MRKLKISLLIVAGVLVCGLQIFVVQNFIKKVMLEQPKLELYEFQSFDIELVSAVFYSSGGKLYHNQKGKLDCSSDPIMDIGEDLNDRSLYVSPNGQLAVLIFQGGIYLVNNRGDRILVTDNCTGEYATNEQRANGRFRGDNIQWSENSKYFILAQDKIWVRNFDENNRTNIYKYDVSKEQLQLLAELNEECKSDFYLSRNGNYIYYQFATSDGDLLYKKISINNQSSFSIYVAGDDRKLDGVSSDSIFINYRDYKRAFQSHSNDLKTVVAYFDGSLYLQRDNCSLNILKGKSGYNKLTGAKPNAFNLRYFIPGNRFYFINVDSERHEGTFVLNVNTGETLKLSRQIEMHYNVNNNHCPDFVYNFFELRPDVVLQSTINNNMRSQVENQQGNMTYRCDIRN